MNTKSSQYRLAIRAEGSHTVAAYFAEHGTMSGALLLGTMSRDIAEKWPDTFEAWKTCMSIVVVHLVENVEGLQVVSLKEQQAPPSELKREGRGAD